MIAAKAYFLAASTINNFNSLTAVDTVFNFVPELKATAESTL
jgi:hypothetical protein